MNGFFGAAPSQAWWGSPWHVIGAAWVIWALSWFAAALWSRRTTARAGLSEEWLYRVITALGVILLFRFWDIPLLRSGWLVSIDLAWAMFGLVVAGMIFTWWARLHLGTLWSSTVTRKQDHRIVDTGPYALVRHPIYTGLLLSAFATAVARGTIGSLIGAVLVLVGFWVKARLEERFLSEDLGPDYAAYRARVKMLVPFLL